uniref:ATP synthase complex subunit 8 n=1 Tax=Epiplatys togolensis TaxID=1795788 RepID=A0A517Y458_9TELE|nr:ATP synthase F0 subunit 8 [Epiplatys togolensis]QDU24727.1 ATP synthase F0 subunit 8 [Epiplatys togolensis]
MPQLNPEPWFMILMFSWVIFLAFLPPKVLAHCVLNEPTNQSAEKAEKTNWNWPWQ